MKLKQKSWIIVIVLVVMAPVMVLAIRHLHRRYQRYVCGQNLKRLGQAQLLYANDYDDDYVIQGESGSIKWTSDPNGF